MNNYKSSGKRIFVVILLLFALNIGYIVKLIAFDRTDISTNAYNPRLSYSDDNIKRGKIKDCNMEELAHSEKTEDGYERVYDYGSLGCHVIGYNSVSKSGIEAHENFRLQHITNEIQQRINNILFGDEIIGDSVILTVNNELQKVAKEALGDNKGAVVAMEPDTGKILAMISYPDFDPSEVENNWDELRTDEESPLLNRCVSGVYAPGSTFKIVTALAAMRSNKIDIDSFTIECTGQKTFKDKVIHCFDEKAHGEVDLRKAMAVSCNCYFAEVAKIIGAPQLKATAEGLGINNKISFELGNSVSSFLLKDDSSESELVETSIGQGKTGVTPLYMAQLFSAVANNGVMMKPYIVDMYQDYKGNEFGQKLPEKAATVMSASEAEHLKDIMTEVVNSGTGSAAAVKGWQVAGKTGTAENSTGTDHSWFVGFAPAENPKIAVAVVLENPKNNKKATPIAGKIIKSYKSLLNE